MSTNRPQYRPTWATDPTSRLQPAGGTAASGYPYGTAPPSKEWNWLHGHSGDWLGYLDNTAIRHSDLASSGVSMRLSATRLDFTVGGPLAQRPTAGGVYVIGAERVDLSATGLSAPVYSYAANATNYVWARSPLSVSRLGYGDTAITQVPVAPGSGYVHILTVTTGPLTVTVVTEPATVKLGHYWRELSHQFQGDLTIAPLGTQTPLTVRPLTGASEGILAEPGDVTFVGPLFRAGSMNATGIGLDGFPSGSGLNMGALAKAYCGDRGAGLFATVDGPFSSGMAAVVSRMLGQGFDLAFEPGGSAPTEQGNTTGHLRVYTENQTAGGGLRWLEPTAGEIRLPMVGRDGFIFASASAANTANLTNALGTSTLVQTANVTWRQNHTYLIWVAAETLTSSAPAFTVSFDVQVNGVSILPSGAILCQPDPQLNLENPWLGQLWVYTHAGADVSAVARLRVTHGAVGAGSVSYRTPRILAFGGWR